MLAHKVHSQAQSKKNFKLSPKSNEVSRNAYGANSGLKPGKGGKGAKFQNGNPYNRSNQTLDAYSGMQLTSGKTSSRSGNFRPSSTGLSTYNAFLNGGSSAKREFKRRDSGSLHCRNKVIFNYSFHSGEEQPQLKSSNSSMLSNHRNYGSLDQSKQCNLMMKHADLMNSQIIQPGGDSKHSVKQSEIIESMTS